MIGALPGNLNIENVEEDLKAREESQRQFVADELKPNLAPESGISTSRPNDEPVIECGSQTSEGAGTKEGLRIPLHTVSEEGKEMLQPSSAQIPLEEQREEGQGGPQISGVKGILQGICSSEEAVHVTDGEHEGQNTGGISVSSLILNPVFSTYGYKTCGMCSTCPCMLRLSFEGIAVIVSNIL